MMRWLCYTVVTILLTFIPILAPILPVKAEGETINRCIGTYDSDHRAGTEYNICTNATCSICQGAGCRTHRGAIYYPTAVQICDDAKAKLGLVAKCAGPSIKAVYRYLLCSAVPVVAAACENNSDLSGEASLRWWVEEIARLAGNTAAFCDFQRMLSGASSVNMSAPASLIELASWALTTGQVKDEIQKAILREIVSTGRLPEVTSERREEFFTDIKNEIASGPEIIYRDESGTQHSIKINGGQLPVSSLSDYENKYIPSLRKKASDARKRK